AEPAQGPREPRLEARVEVVERRVEQDDAARTAGALLRRGEEERGARSLPILLDQVGEADDALGALERHAAAPAPADAPPPLLGERRQKLRSALAHGLQECGAIAAEAATCGFQEGDGEVLGTLPTVELAPDLRHLVPDLAGAAEGARRQRGELFFARLDGGG